MAIMATMECYNGSVCIYLWFYLLQCSAKIVTNSLFSDLSSGPELLLSFAIGNHNSDSLLGTSQVVSIVNTTFELA